MSKGSSTNRPTDCNNGRNNIGLMSRTNSEIAHKFKNTEPRRGGSGVRNWVDDSIQKSSASETFSNVFENSVFSTAKKQEKKKLRLKNGDKTERKRDTNIFGQSLTEDYDVKEPPRGLYCDLEESRRISKLGSCASSDIFTATDNSIISSVSSIPHFSEKDVCQNENEKLEFINKYTEAKKKEKKYRKEVKILKMEKKQLQLKTQDVDKHLQIEAEKIIDKANLKIKEKIEKSSKPKLNKVLCRALIKPLCKLLSVSEEKLDPIVDLIKNPSKDPNKSGIDTTPTKSAKKIKEIEKVHNSKVDELNFRIKQLEKENQQLKYELHESSKMQDAHLDNLSHERSRLESMKKELESKSVEDKKSKEDVNSKITNYKTRIFFLESQIEELENKKQSHIDMATNKLRNTNKLLEEEVHKLRKTKDTAEVKLEGLRGKLEEIISEEQQLKKREKDYKKEVEQLKEQVVQLEKKLVEVKTEYADKMYQYEMK